MADIRAFRGLRYDLAKTGSLADLIAPPYDVIDEGLSQRLHAANDHNVIRLILNPTKPEDTDTDNRYTRASKTLRHWRESGALAEEAEPCVYAYFQEFTWEGVTYNRRGFMVRVRLEPFGEGKIYPHEETMPGPKADRLKLFHATGMNLSQIFGLYPDADNEVANSIEEAVRGKTPLEAVDHLGVTHRLWTVTDPETVSKIQGLMGPKPIFIADGHHRYETSCKHLEEREAAGKVTGPEDPSCFTLMMLVGMDDPGLKVMPTHRLVSGLPGITSAQLQDRLGEVFKIEAIGSGEEKARQACEAVESSDRQDMMAFGTTSDQEWFVATLKDPKAMDAAVSDHSEVWKSLGVSILHRLALGKCLEGMGTPSCTYVHLVDEVLESMAAKSCDLCCIVQPATVEHIRALASKFEKMPPKSTYFYPKLASGLVFNPIH
ncbi:hypothetical protein Pan216_07230 [Planctomycetes bacterium Pan216]|uniref:DUF1015 domain-containing protein n=1 Tax=Kolteria novifilia TaxID=2527975 RepID=A0A518AYX6_9BACT|nr:hypothetical protein Pan216_07230 [Planctomycetes bacterium Pan216]